MICRVSRYRWFTDDLFLGGGRRSPHHELRNRVRSFEEETVFLRGFFEEEAVFWR